MHVCVCDKPSMSGRGYIQGSGGVLFDGMFFFFEYVSSMSCGCRPICMYAYVCTVYMCGRVYVKRVCECL